jgi:hypothetical protein
MLASAAITRLQQTELKQLSGASLTDAVVLEYLNEAILELHKRFNIWQDEAIITHATDITIYTLEEADVNVDIDLSDKILVVITEAVDYLGDPLSLNDEDDQFGAVTPKYNIVEFPLEELVVDEEFSILFRASPLDMTDVGDTIDLPPTLFEAMYFYVGFRAHVSQKGTKDTENANHFARFIDACNRVQAQGLIVAESTVQHKFAGLTYPWP